MPVPSTLGVLPVESFVLLTMLYAFAPFVEASANKITLPSALIWLTFISLFKLAILISEPVPELFAVITPSIDVFTDFVKSLPLGPTPVQTPSAQGPTSSPIAPFVTVTFKSAPLEVAISVVDTPLFNKFPSETKMFTSAFEVMLLFTPAEPIDILEFLFTKFTVLVLLPCFATTEPLIFIPLVPSLYTSKVELSA